MSPTYVALGISPNYSQGDIVTLCLIVGDRYTSDTHKGKIVFSLPEGVKIKSGQPIRNAVISGEGTFDLGIQITKPGRYVISAGMLGLTSFGEATLVKSENRITFYEGWSGWTHGWENIPATAKPDPATQWPDLDNSLNWIQRNISGEIWYMTKNAELFRGKGIVSHTTPIKEPAQTQIADFMNYYHSWLSNHQWERLYSRKSYSETSSSVFVPKEEYLYEKKGAYVNFGIEYNLYGKDEGTYQFFIKHN